MLHVRMKAEDMYDQSLYNVQHAYRVTEHQHQHMDACCVIMHVCRKAEDMASMSSDPSVIFSMHTE